MMRSTLAFWKRSTDLWVLGTVSSAGPATGADVFVVLVALGGAATTFVGSEVVFFAGFGFTVAGVTTIAGFTLFDWPARLVLIVINAALRIISPPSNNTLSPAFSEWFFLWTILLTRRTT